jgi:hypothetical protein
MWMSSRARRGMFAGGVLFWFFGLPIWAHPVMPVQEAAEGRPDYTLARSEIQNFELVVNNAINSTFSTSPFALVQKPKGVYLQGYGVAFSFLINIHRAVINTPFGEVRTQPDITPELKKRRIEEIKDKLMHVLADSGDILKQLRKDDSVAIVMFLEDRNFPDEPNENKTIVLSILRKDLDEVVRSEDRWKELKQRIKIVEY